MTTGNPNPPIFSPDVDHECDDLGEGEETGLCNECRDYATFCSCCQMSGCCGARECSCD
jgi:hypothetical protein